MKERIVLIADDDESDIFFLRQALSEVDSGIRVHDVVDGQEAIAYLAGEGPYRDRNRHPLPTHLFLDLKMPRRTGLEVLRWVRGRPEFAKISVAILSGSQLAQDQGQVAALGAEYFVKPVGYSALLDIARHFFGVGARPSGR
jgi:CheY-like chemotaxis protein